jgi:ATP-dependent helicase/nuclease subunit B
MGAVGRVLDVPFGRPFLQTVASAVLNGDLPRQGMPRPTPEALAGFTIYLPTRRAARAMQDAFLDASQGRALLLPQLRPIGDVDEDASLVAAAAAFAPTAAPAIGEAERLVALTSLVLRWSQAQRHGGSAATAVTGARTAAQAVALARELSSLIDQLETERVDPARLRTLVPEDHAAHWAKTLDFLDIVLTMWPAFLAERGLVSPAQNRNQLLTDEARRLSQTPPAHPVIIAGVVGSVPATLDLMRAVTGLENGAIVLSGLDRGLDEKSFAAAARDLPEHPQAGLARLLQSLGLSRDDVGTLRGNDDKDDREPIRLRQRIVSEAMRPASTIAGWRDVWTEISPEAAAGALAGIERIDAPSEPVEAEAIALVLREVIETPDRTAALVTRDRLLARRVAARLATWGIEVDDSAGRPFAKSAVGAFLDLVIEAVASGFTPTATMALLKHPLTRLAMEAGPARRAARHLELAAFRTVYLGRGLDDVEAAVEQASQDRQSGISRHAAQRRLRDADLAGVRDLLSRLRKALAPLLAASGAAGPIPMHELIWAHASAAEAMAARPETGTHTHDGLWSGEAGEAGQALLAALGDPANTSIEIPFEDYADLYRGLVAGEVVRPRRPAHPRISIWGPLEARLQQPDVVVLGSLNDGVWPQIVDTGPWLNRPMRRELGLPSPEARTGDAAHDFCALLGAPRVVLTRAAKVGGVPQVPSRWLMRLDALLAGSAARVRLEEASQPLAWALHRDAAPRAAPAEAPAPAPVLALRPRRLSVTEIERWMANPYAIFARHVLGLAPLDPLGRQPDAALRGMVIHGALGRFAARFPAVLPVSIADALMDAAREELSRYGRHPRVAAFWLPRLHRFADWFAATEPLRRAPGTKTFAEVAGAHVLPAPGGPFTLAARADRIDVAPSGVAILDYKTGSMPTAAALDAGRAPQLPLEAMIAAAGGFAGVPAMLPQALCYVRVRGGEPPGEEMTIDAKVSSLVDAARQGLTRLVHAYDDPATPYRAMRRARFADRYAFDDYAHLARVAEWAAEDGDDA